MKGEWEVTVDEGHQTFAMLFLATFYVRAPLSAESRR
jgi:hypothetical protein